LEKVTNILVGQKTEQFTRFDTKYEHDNHKSLSLIYLDDELHKRSFDIVVFTDKEFEFWYGAIKMLVQKFKKLRDGMSIQEMRSVAKKNAFLTRLELDSVTSGILPIQSTREHSPP